MNTTFSAATGQKTGLGVNPFDEITHMEAQEKARAKKEIAAMEQERAEVEKAVAEKQAQAEEELKGKARTELKEYKETELAQILQNAEKEAERRCDALEKTFEANKVAAAKELVAAMTNPDSLLFR